jgi:hypothetical protein
MTRMNPKRLTDLLSGKDVEDLLKRFDETEPAAEYEPVPPGRYEVDFVRGEACRSSRGTPGYTGEFEISKGEYQGRRLWHTFWLTEAADAYTKRDLSKLGITRGEQLNQPVPPGIFCFVQVVVRTDDNGVERNVITRMYEGGIRTDTMADADFAGPPLPDRKQSACEAVRPADSERVDEQKGGDR